ncbi:hypothetical protein DOB18_19485 [Salmonella enterica subsp. enterica serovar Java]|uniref:tyrosine-type recombinase/integrase n=1 Tax=Enterobacteriaceae TaxID=543 RepID=UPI000A39A8E8|nr:MULTISPECIES: tyrosine-type recombinase/integrase [Enterobacteriaceae]EBS1030515.1 hypothetical protein [Salmonella enterica subsp. enterica serovar Java]EBW6387938.1 hypothetical protein [Salmonella enterica subsp. enterica serovar Stanley]MCY5677609.1 tyrosine-type recombinase/integrase [Salmonella enterica subsp. enterica serovar 1,4,[5],12:i:-]MDJ2944442.1 site-specific integrase [Salmonella enterica]MDZ6375153.1 tyrosine-type recombinase/integrase [Klebsiella pneumoniae]USJ84609.1 sit
MHRRVLTERHFHLSVREPPFRHHDRPAATAPLPADRPPGVPPCLLYSITADRCCRRDAPQNPHGRPDTSCRSAPPPDQWQKCLLRADLRPGPAVVRRLLPHAVLPGGGPVLPAAEAVPRPGRRPSARQPAADSGRAGYAASRHPPDDGRTEKARIWEVTDRTVRTWIGEAVAAAAADGVTFSVPVTPHTFRHSYAMHMLYAGIPLKVLQSLMGHKSISSTEVYTKVFALDVAARHRVQFAMPEADAVALIKQLERR